MNLKTHEIGFLILYLSCRVRSMLVDPTLSFNMYQTWLIPSKVILGGTAVQNSPEVPGGHWQVTIPPSVMHLFCPVQVPAHSAPIQPSSVPRSVTGWERSITAESIITSRIHPAEKGCLNNWDVREFTNFLFWIFGFFNIFLCICSNFVNWQDQKVPVF